MNFTCSQTLNTGLHAIWPGSEKMHSELDLTRRNQNIEVYYPVWLVIKTLSSRMFDTPYFNCLAVIVQWLFLTVPFVVCDRGIS